MNDIEKAIEELKEIYPSEKEIKTGEYPHVADSIDLAISALEKQLNDENLEEQLKSLQDENIGLKKWNACEQELYEKLLADSERLIEVEAELTEYKDLEEQGLLIKLPCKVGDTVYVNAKTFGTHDDIEYAEAEVISIRITKKQTFLKLRIFALGLDGMPYGCKNYSISSIGKTVFLTKVEAEKALDELLEVGE